MGCRYGKLARPVREKGAIRRCKIAHKTHAGRVADRKRKSSEYHERRYRREK